MYLLGTFLAMDITFNILIFAANGLVPCVELRGNATASCFLAIS